MRRLGIGGLGHWRRLSVLAAFLLVCLCAGGQSAYAGGPKPVISELAASPATVFSGGTTTVSASVSGATSCTLSASKAVSGLPATFACEGGSVSREVTMPTNTGTKSAKYKLTLAATGATGGPSKAKITVTVGGPKAVGVTAAEHDTCALLADRHIDCWGEERDGALGNGKKSKKPQNTPAEVQGISDAVQVSAGREDTCAVLSTGHIDCWGRTSRGNSETEHTGRPAGHPR